MSRWFMSYGYSGVAEGLSVGAFPLDDEDVRALEFLGVQRVLNLVEDAEYEPGSREIVTRELADAGIEEERLRLTDYGHLSPDELDEAVTTINRWLDAGLKTYVHCRAGWQRSAAVAAAVVALREELDIDTAVRVVRDRKPSADPLPHQREDLRRWWERRHSREALS